MSSFDSIAPSCAIHSYPGHVARWGRTARRCTITLSLAFAVIASGPALAATYAVGSGAGCTHSTVQAALTAAATNPSGPHLIKLTSGTLAVPNGLILHNPQANVTLEGGYASCAATAATTGQRSTLDATGGNDGTVLDIRSNAFRIIRLSRLTITGGTGESGAFASSEGGGLELRGDLDVLLDQGTRIEGNRANRAAGVLIQGGPGYVRLWIGPGAQIRNNVAETDGGGVWCFNLGLVELADSSISSNEAGRDGGGLWMGNQCRLFVTVSPGQVSQFSLNTAGTRFDGIGQGRGGAVFYRSSQPFSSAVRDIDIGTNAANAGATFFVGNRALNRLDGLSAAGGGALYIEGQAAERVPMRIRDAIFVDNQANSWGSAISLNRAVDLIVEGRAGRCDGAFGFGLCSAFAAHTSPGGGAPGLIMLDPLRTTTAAAQPRLTLRRVRTTDNVLNRLIESNIGAVAGGMRLDIESSLFDSNQFVNLLDIYADASLRFSTVIDNALPQPFMLTLGSGQRLDLSGSILWQPGVQLVRDLGRPFELIHNGCLLSHTRNQITNADPVIVADPQLGSDFTPGPASPALDVCNDFLPGDGRDAYGQLRPVDQPGVPNRPGAHDLGAVERPLGPGPVDAIFQNGFE